MSDMQEMPNSVAEADRRRFLMTAGKFADLTVFPAVTEDPLAGLLDQPILPTAVWINGRKI